MDYSEYLIPGISSDFLKKENPTKEELDVIIKEQQIIGRAAMDALAGDSTLEEWAEMNLQAGINPDDALDMIYLLLIEEGMEK